MAAIGSLMTFLGWVPDVGIYISIVGFVLLLIGMKGLSEYYKDGSIFRNTISGVVFGIVGSIALFIALLIVAGSVILGSVGLFAGIIGIVAAVLLLVVVFIFYVLMALSLRKAFFALSDRSGEHLFHTAGSLLFIGAVLTIIVIGIVLVFIAWLIAMIAFFSIRTGPQPQSYAYPPPSTPSTSPAPTTNTETKYCPHCGAPVEPGAAFCSHCGKQI